MDSRPRPGSSVGRTRSCGARSRRRTIESSSDSTSGPPLRTAPCTSPRRSRRRRNGWSECPARARRRGPWPAWPRSARGSSGHRSGRRGVEAADAAHVAAGEARGRDASTLSELREERAAADVERARAPQPRGGPPRPGSRAGGSVGGARRVLEACASGEGPCREDELLGLVADHLGADVRLARAIDAVLGERAQALVARDAHVARRVVDWCASEEVGQVAVVIPPGIGSPDCPAAVGLRPLRALRRRRRGAPR